jgi:hypothetical protein
VVFTHSLRRAWWVALAAIAALGLVLMFNGPAKGSAQSAVPSVTLSPANEVPTSTANGGGMFFWNVTKDSLEADLSGDSTEKLTAAHIHLGAKGVNGPVVVTLFVSGEDGVRDFHVLPVIKAKDFAGPLKDKSWNDFLKELYAGNLYVNIHSKDHPAGLMRAQIPALPGPPPSGTGLASSDSGDSGIVFLGAALVGVAGGATVLTFARSRRRS